MTRHPHPAVATNPSPAQPPILDPVAPRVLPRTPTLHSLLQSLCFWWLLVAWNSALRQTVGSTPDTAARVTNRCAGPGEALALARPSPLPPPQASSSAEDRPVPQPPVPQPHNLSVRRPRRLSGPTQSSHLLPDPRPPCCRRDCGRPILPCMARCELVGSPQVPHHTAHSPRWPVPSRLFTCKPFHRKKSRTHANGPKTPS